MKIILTYFRLLICIISVTTLASCKAIIIETIVKDKSALKKMKILSRGNKEIIYIPMVHIGSNKYYNEIKEFLKEKRNLGYLIFYEGVQYDLETIGGEKHLVDLKLRRLLGFHLTSLNEKENKSLPKYVNHSKSVYQTKENIGLDTLLDINADLTRKELVNLYESEFGEVILDSCDFNTPLYEDYDCSKGQAYYKVVYKYREYALIEKLLTSKHDKIVLLFGKSHWIKSIYPDLVYKHGFELVKGKI